MPLIQQSSDALPGNEMDATTCIVISGETTAFLYFHTCINKPKYWDRQFWVNSVDPDQTLMNAASEIGFILIVVNAAIFFFYTTGKKIGHS